MYDNDHDDNGSMTDTECDWRPVPPADYDDYPAADKNHPLPDWFCPVRFVPVLRRLFRNEAGQIMEFIEGGDDDEVWCVFDHDTSLELDYCTQHYETALIFARDMNIRFGGFDGGPAEKLINVDGLRFVAEKRYVWLTATKEIAIFERPDEKPSPMPENCNMFEVWCVYDHDAFGIVEMVAYGNARMWCNETIALEEAARLNRLVNLWRFGV